MKTYRLSSGQEMPALGLGTWKSDPGVVGAAISAALETGYRHVDCAPIYGNEAEIGAVLGAALDAGTVRREDLWITSKLWNNAHGRDRVLPALKDTLRDLRLDYLDLYLVHWPVPIRPGITFPQGAGDFLSLDDQPLADTWAGMEDAVDAGLARAIGVSNFSAPRLAALAAGARIPPAVNQVELHPYLAQSDLLEAARDLGVRLTAYSPLGSMDRPERLKKADEPVLLDDPVVAAVADAHGATPGQVLIAWALARNTAVIPKTSRPERLAENLAAAQLDLTQAGLARLEGLDRGYRYVDGSFWCIPGSPHTLDNLWG
jgi:alcohol dehydrogenase (NADP+)